MTLDPEYLACKTTNTQLEPIRRAIESSIPKTNTIFPVTSSESDINQQISGKHLQHRSTYNSLGHFVAPPKSTSSLDNPFLNLTPEEYRTLRFDQFH